MVVQFRTNGKGRSNMSSVLLRLSGKTSGEILEVGEENNITTDIMDIAKKWGVKLRFFDFQEIEKEARIDAGTVLGAIVDNDENDTLTIFLKNRLSNSTYYDSKTAGEKIDILRRRQRFTVAHELAHACLHLEAQDIKFRLDYHSDEDEYIAENVPNIYDSEYAANVFAGELLMPERWVIYVLKKLISPSIEAFSRIFDVSKTVVKERLKYLGMLDVVESAE